MMTRKTIRMPLLFLLLAGAGPGTDTASRPGVRPPGPRWEDGLAELARYDATTVVYGRPRTHETLLITVKETFALDGKTKADPPYADRPVVEVLKLNRIAEIPTPNYPYRYMGSVFLRRDDPRVVLKAGVTSQEWCGTSFHEFRPWTEPASLVFHTYFDGEGDGEKEIVFGEGDMIEDQLLATVRFFDYGAPFTFRTRLLPSLYGNGAPSGAMYEATVRFDRKETIAAAGERWYCFRVEVEGSGKRRIFHVADDEARTLVAYEESGGGSLRLRSVARRDYWTRNEPEPGRS